ncbi:MAG TPA: hypothetical protein VNM22_15865 [Candidatus Limnocylindrales bacterium]|nr:hypothetical protein [Candidatus Limnocylindrales bacterium]
MVQTKGPIPTFRVLAFGLGIFLGSYLLLVASLEGIAEENKTLLQSPTPPVDQAATLTSILETLQTGYSPRMVLGEPMDVEGIKIIPVALIGVGIGEQKGDQGGSMSRGGGAVISPVGVILLSSRGVEWLPVQKGLFTQFLEGVSSLFLTIWKMRDYATQPSPSVPEKIVSPQKTLLTRLFWTLPDRFRFGFLPVPLGYQLLFLISWVGTVILAGTFFSGFLNRIGSRLSETPLRAGLWGLLSLLLTLLTLLLLTLSIIGVPLMVVIGLLMIGALWLGLSSMALLTGQRIALSLGGRPLSSPIAALLGAVLLGALRLLPFVGWILWMLLSILGFGAILLTVLRNHTGEQGVRGIR